MKVVKNIDDFLKVLSIEDFLTIISDKIVIKSEQVKNCKTWWEIGFDELDEVEVVISIESKYNCQIYDEFCARLYSEVTPSELYNHLLKKERDEKLNEIGI